MNGKSNYFKYHWYYHVSDMTNLENNALISFSTKRKLNEAVRLFSIKTSLAHVSYKKYETVEIFEFLTFSRSSLFLDPLASSGLRL